jgi:histone H3/H4
VAAIRLSDPLWYKLEDYVLPAVADESVMSGDVSAKILPEQVQIVEAALDKNGLTRSDVTPQAFACLLEQSRRYAIDILSDSQDYAFVANRVEITKADLGKLCWIQRFII